MPATKLHLVDPAPESSLPKSEASTATRATKRQSVAKKAYSASVPGNASDKRSVSSESPRSTAHPNDRKAALRTKQRPEKRAPQAMDVMFGSAVCCRATDTLNVAAQLMWEHDLGAIVVVNQQHEPVSVVTDRDLCMAVYTQGLPLYEIGVESTMSKSMVTCSVDTPLKDVRRQMAEHQLRRIPVTDLQGKLAGMIGITDLAIEALAPLTKGRRRGSSSAEILELVGALHAPAGQQRGVSAS
jgi:CBS domain-containing protein